MHLLRILAAMVAALSLLALAFPAGSQTARDAELVKGIGQLENGDLDDAVTTLEAVVKKLSGRTGQEHQLAQAYLHLGLAHAQLDSHKAARASFREALKQDPTVKVDDDRWPPQVLRLFEAVRADMVQPAPTAAPHAGAVKTNAVDGLDYVWIPPGTFEMGCVPGDSECHADERPQHAVTLSRGFWLGKTEVTKAAFRKFAAQRGYITTAEKEGFAYEWEGKKWAQRKGTNWRNPGFPQSDSNPVVDVSWDDAHAFCNWSGGRLPTEAEWEYAARARRETIYVWGNEQAPIKDGRKQANVAEMAEPKQTFPPLDPAQGHLGRGTPIFGGRTGTAPVASFAANGFALYDMAGNASEWCADWYAETYYTASPTSDPPGAASGTFRVLRGGSWLDPPTLTRVSDRTMLRPAFRVNSNGLRCIRDVSP